MRRTMTILGATAALLTGCNAPAEREPQANAAASPRPVAASPAPTPPPAPPPERSPAGNEIATEEKTDDFTFAYSYPAAAASIPALDAWLRRDREGARRDLASETAEARRDATKEGYPFRPYESSTGWAVVTETPRLLSLSAETWDYSGGAHGNPGFRALVWDKVSGRRLEPTDLFASKAALQKAIGDAFCRLIDQQRAKRRGGPVVRSADDTFSACPKVEEATLILGSTNRRAIDRLGLLVGPYVAGPYAEGSYEVTIPVTPAVLAAVRPEWRPAFATR